MSVKYALLGVLMESPQHGYEIKKSLDERMGAFWSLNVGQIYTTLDRLEKEGLVLYEEVAQYDKPDKKIYQVTDAGRAEFEDWRRRPIKPEPRMLRDELFLKILFADETNADALLTLIQSQRSVYQLQLMQLTQQKYQADQTAQQRLRETSDGRERGKIERERLITTVLLDAAIFHAEADIRWLHHCEARIKALL